MQSPLYNTREIAIVTITLSTILTLLRGGIPWALEPSSQQPRSGKPLNPYPTPARPPGNKDTLPMTACQCQISKIKKKDPCCRRRIVGVHKGGHVFVSQFREKFLPKVNSVFVRSNSTQTKLLYDETVDYREVFVARDLYEMVISGYLYHKSGRECWLGKYGEPIVLQSDHQDNNLISGWEQVLQKPYPYTAINGRSLCQYLADESPEVGIRVYSEYALYRWYRPFFDLIDRRTSGQDTSRTMFLDLHQLENETLRGALLPVLRDFFVLSNKSVHSLGQDVRNREHESTTHDHGHDTNHDPKLRMNLKDLIQQVDQTILDSWIERHHQWPPAHLLS